MPLPHQQHNARKRSDGKKSRDAKDPAHTHGGDPRINEERDSEAEDETVEAHNARRLRRAVDEAFADVVGGRRHERHGADSDEECAERQDEVVQVVFESCAEETETDGQHEETGDPKTVQTVLGPPDTAATSADPEWQTIAKSVGRELGNDEAYP